MVQFTIHCHPGAPVSVDELEGWLLQQVDDVRAASPEASVRLSRLTQALPGGDIDIGWLLELGSRTHKPEWHATNSRASSGICGYSGSRRCCWHPTSCPTAKRLDSRLPPRRRPRGTQGARDYALQGTVEPARMGRARLGVASDGHPDATVRVAGQALDRVLQLMERRHSSASEFRILLALLDGEISCSELAAAVGRPSEEIRRVAARLYGRGLLRWRHDAASKEAVFGITRAGLATLQPC